MDESFLQPLCFLETLTLRAVTVPTRVVRDPDLFAAIAARVDVSTEGGGATLLDVSHDVDLGRGRLIATAIFLAVRTHDVRDLETRPWHGAQPRTLASGVPRTSSGLLTRWMCWELTLVYPAVESM